MLKDPPLAWTFVLVPTGSERSSGVPPAQIALAWLLHKPAVTAPIIGATKPDDEALLVGGALQHDHRNLACRFLRVVGELRHQLRLLVEQPLARNSSMTPLLKSSISDTSLLRRQADGQ